MTEASGSAPPAGGATGGAVDGARPDRAARLIDELMGLHPKGYDLSLGRIARLLDRLGRPQDRLPPVVHVAGTNGKGSTIALMRAGLEAAGHRVHVHTSPHLVRWHERYRLATGPGQSAHVADAVLHDAIRRVAEANGGEAITVFELLTAAGFVLFAEHPADVALVEVGLGGRLDSTNVIENKALTVITPVGLDHQSYLGDTLAAIAGEKAGILRRGVPLVVGEQDGEAMDAIERAAGRLGIVPVAFGEHFRAHEEGGRMVWQEEDGTGEGRLLDLPLPALAGRHQIANAATAVAALGVLARRTGLAVPASALERGLRAAEWPGRLQRLAHGPLVAAAPKGAEIWLDGGHNGHAALALADHMAALAERAPRPLFLVAGMLDTKVPLDFFRPFAGLVRHAFTVPLSTTEAGVAPERLAEWAREAGLSAEPAGSAAAALGVLRRDWRWEPDHQEGPRILVTGSLYLAGETLAGAAEA